MGSSSSKQSASMTFSTSGTGVKWDSGLKILDDSSGNLNVTAPASKFSGSVDATGGFTVKGAKQTIPGSSNALTFVDDGSTGIGWGTSKIYDKNGNMFIVAPDSVTVTTPSAKFSGSLDAASITINGSPLTQGPKGDTGPQGPKGDTGPAGTASSIGGSTGISFNTDGTGIKWPSGSSAIYDSGDLHFDTDDNMHFNAPKVFDVTSPSSTFSGNVSVAGKNVIELGYGNTKETAAGKIGYQTYTTDALDIVGAGTVAGQRKIKLWDNVNVYGTLDANAITIGGKPLTSTTSSSSIGGSTGVSFTNNGTGIKWVNSANTTTSSIYDDADLRINTDDNIHFNAPTLFEVVSPKSTFSGTLGVAGKNYLEFGTGVASKEGAAGKIGYQTFSNSLDIVGAGTDNTSRSVKIWDNLSVPGTLTANTLSSPMWVGPYYVLLNSDQTKALDSSALSSNHMFNTLNRATTTQQWMREPVTGMLKNVGNGQCLTVNKTTNALSFIACDSTNSGQQWVRGAQGEIISAVPMTDGTSRCIDVNAGTANVPAYTYACQNNNNNQMFSFSY